MKVKVKVLKPIYENGKEWKVGEEFETTLERAKALAHSVKIIKGLEKPPKDKMVKKTKHKEVK